IGSYTYLRFAFALRRAAQRAFIHCESLRRPAAVIPLPRFLAGFARPRAARNRAQRARAAAAIFARALADNWRFPPRRRGAADLAAPPPLPPTKPLSRRSNASIWRRIDNACSSLRVDKSIERFR